MFVVHTFLARSETPLALVRRGLRRACALAGLVTAVCAPALVSAQEVVVPVSVQIPLFLKVLSFDRALGRAGEPQVVIGIAFQSGNRVSARAKDEALRLLRDSKEQVGGKQVHAVSIDLDKDTLAVAMRRHRISVLYVTPLRAYDVAQLASATRDAGVTSLSGTDKYIALGLAVGIMLQGEFPKIVINLRQARMEGADFSAELLKLAVVNR